MSLIVRGLGIRRMSAFDVIFSSNYMSLFLRREQILITQLQIVNTSKIFVLDAKKLETLLRQPEKKLVKVWRSIDRSPFEGKA